jgi:hypothetical protein
MQRLSLSDEVIRDMQKLRQEKKMTYQAIADYFSEQLGVNILPGKVHFYVNFRGFRPPREKSKRPTIHSFKPKKMGKSYLEILESKGMSKKWLERYKKDHNWGGN